MSDKQGWQLSIHFGSVEIEWLGWGLWRADSVHKFYKGGFNLGLIGVWWSKKQ